RYDGLLELSLALIPDVLPLAAATLAGAEIGAGRLDPVRAGLQHLDQAGARPAFLFLDNLGAHTLAGDGVGHEDRLARVPPDAFTAVRDGINYQIHVDDLSYAVRGRVRKATARA